MASGSDLSLKGVLFRLESITFLLPCFLLLIEPRSKLGEALLRDRLGTSLDLLGTPWLDLHALARQVDVFLCQMLPSLPIELDA